MDNTDKSVSFKGHKQGVQGDVCLTRIDKLPDDIKPATVTDGKWVVAHSETGHDHAVLERTATMYESKTDPLLAFLVVDSDAAGAELKHYRSYQTHGTVALDKGIYRINRQREHTPQGLRRVAD